MVRTMAMKIMHEYHVTADVYLKAKTQAEAESMLKGARNYIRRKLEIDFDWGEVRRLV